MTRMKASVCRYCNPRGSSTQVCRSHVTTVESVSTKATDAPIPKAVEIFLDTPRKGQMPRNWLRMILLTNIAPMKIKRYSMIYFFALLKIAMR